jgi:tetratricopeptide (TPR) repeat protein
MDWFRTAIGRNKGYGECYVLLSESLEALGRKEEALAQLELGAKEAPSNAAVRQALGEAYFKVGRFGEARASFESVVKADPSGPHGRRATDMLRNLPR